MPAVDVGLQKGVYWKIPHRLEKETSVSDNAGLQRGVDCEIPHRLVRETKHSL